MTSGNESGRGRKKGFYPVRESDEETKRNDGDNRCRSIASGKNREIRFSPIKEGKKGKVLVWGLETGKKARR